MRKTLSTALVLILMLAVSTSSVFALNYGSFYPAKSVNTKVSDKNGTYTDNANGKMHGSIKKAANIGGKTIVPQDSLYLYGVLRKSDKEAKTTKIRGTTIATKTATKTIHSKWSKNWKATPQQWWFKASSKPEVEYTGYRIWDDVKKKYINLKIRTKLVGYNASHIQKEAKGVTPSIAFSNSSDGGFFNGLPGVAIAAIGTAHVRHTFYDADTGAKYPIRTNITYIDIDDKQAISIKIGDVGGFTATDNVNLSFGGYSGYYVTQSNSNTNEGDNDTSYWMGMNVDSGADATVDMLYSSNQKQYKNGKFWKIGKPNGCFSYFGTRTYAKKPPSIEITDSPTKKVFDSNGKNDVKPKGHDDYGTHNKLSSSKQEFYYRVYQKIPGGMKWDSDLMLTKFILKDTVDNCLNVTGAKVYQKYDGEVKDVSKHFTIKKASDYTYTATLKNTKAAHNAIYKPGKSTIFMEVYAKVVADEEKLLDHTDWHSKTSHLVGTMNFDIADKGEVTIQAKGKDQIKKKTNQVKTRIPRIPKHDLIIKKNVTGEAPDKKKKFEFSVKFNNGSKFSYTIKRASGNTETGTGVFNKGKTFSLAHGEILTIKEVPQTVAYTIEEKGENQYVPSYNVTNTGNCLENHKNSDSVAEGTNLIATGKFNKAANMTSVTYAFSNKRVINHHNLAVKKNVVGDGNNDTFTYTIKLSNLEENKAYATSVGNKTSNANGELSFNFSLKHGERFYINQLPDSAKYQITEAGSAEYKPSYKVTTGSEYVSGATGSSEVGKALSTAKETLKDTGTDYNVEYTFTNRKLEYSYAHDLILTKKIEGTKANKDDEFTYNVKFENLPKENGVYKKIGAELYTWVGEKDVYGSIAEKEIASNSYTETITLKAGQYVIFNDIPESVKYTVTEQISDYVASYTAVKKNLNNGNTMSKWDAANNKSHTVLSDTKTLDKKINTETTYTFTNKRDKEPIYNALALSKVATDGTSEQFDFTINLTGLAENKTYALFGEGETEYTLVNENGSLRVRSGKDTLGDPYKYVAGVPLTVTRADGEKKVIFTSSAADGNLAEIMPWIDYKGGTYTLSWIGTDDKYTGHIETFTSNESGNATVNLPLGSDKKVNIMGLPQGTAYTVKESANLYDPSYTIMRDKVKVDYANGKLSEDLTTKKQTFNQDKETNDTVTFRNNKESYMLRSNKIVTDMSGKLFDFMAEITNLSKDKYMSMVPGEGDFEIQMTPVGVIKLVASNYSDSIENIPIKLIRPCDNAEKVFYTDVNGEIDPSEFIEWLSKEQKGDYKFTLEWNGGRVTGSFDAE